MNKRSLIEKQKLQREARQLYQKWTFIYLSIIVAYTLILIISLTTGFWYPVPGLILGICLFGWGLSKAKSSYKRHLKIINQIVEEIKQQEDLEAEIKASEEERAKLQKKEASC